MLRTHINGTLGHFPPALASHLSPYCWYTVLADNARQSKVMLWAVHTRSQCCSVREGLGGRESMHSGHRLNEYKGRG